MPDITPSSALPAKDMAIVFGPPGTGKTFSTFTRSDKCPADLTHVRPKALPKREPVVLDDLLWVLFDQDGLAGAPEQGIVVPTLDMTGVELPALPTEIQDVHRKVKSRAAELAAVGRRLTTVVDTVSSLDQTIQAYAGQIMGLKEIQFFGGVAEHHRRFLLPLLRLDCDLVMLSHAKALIDLHQASQKTRIAALGSSAVEPAITGQAQGVYKANATYIFSIHLRSTPQGVAQVFRSKHPTFEGKSRRLTLPEELPADWRVVRAALGSAPPP